MYQAHTVYRAGILRTTQINQRGSFLPLTLEEPNALPVLWLPSWMVLVCLLLCWSKTTLGHLLAVNTGTGTIVDVGDGTGSISIELARSFPGLDFVVQDLPGTVPETFDRVPKDIAGRIRFTAHNCFESQPQTADVFLFRMIFHNWSDEHVVNILKATVPGLKAGIRVVFNGYLVLEPKTVSLLKERTVR